MFYRARYYDPGIGRFIAEDPIGFGGGDTNIYRYVFNGPLHETDPSGMFISDAGLRCLTAAGGAATGTFFGVASRGLFDYIGQEVSSVSEFLSKAGKFITDSDSDKFLFENAEDFFIEVGKTGASVGALCFGGAHFQKFQALLTKRTGLRVFLISSSTTFLTEFLLELADWGKGR